MADPNDDSLGSGATRVGGNKPDDRYQVSLGDQSTFGGGPGHDDTMLESEMEIVDLASRYTIEGPLGKGGMGEVLLATDTRLKRKVAIKRVRGEKLQSSVAISRFLTEAQSIASLNHFNIVQVYDYGRDKDGPFFIMEYVDGSSLLDRCSSGAIPIDEAINITCQLCDGLGRAHELGIIHRDIKPANILMTKDGKPKLTDFGLAKQDIADHGQTMAGVVLGTLDFMPPEQRRDVSLTDARSDLWSLAATFYQMVTGRSPKVIRFSNLPVSLHAVLEKALEDRQEDRYQSASEFRDALLSGTNKTATVLVPDADLGTGQCPSCHTNNESHRKFCRECATSLRVSCLSCKVEIPVWDKVCPECGKKQAELVAARRTEMEAKRLEAEHEFDQSNFYEATRIAKSIVSETDSRLQYFNAWADAFRLKVIEEQDRQEKFSWKQYTEALKHRTAFDYPSAIRALEVIPEVMRSREMSQLLDKLNEEEKESISLIKLVTERLEKRELNGLQELMHRAIELRGNDEVLLRLKLQFDNMVVTRDKAVAEASARLKCLDYPGCIAALQAIEPRLETQEIVSLRELAEEKNQEVIGLVKLITERIEKRELDGLQELLDRAMELRGNDEVLVNLQNRLTELEIQIKQWDRIFFNAQHLFEQGNAQEAWIALTRIPNVELKANRQEFKGRIESIVSKELKLVAAFNEAVANEILEPAKVELLLQFSDGYLQLNPNHEGIRLRRNQLIEQVIKRPMAYRDLLMKMPILEIEKLPKEIQVQIPPIVNSVGMALKFIPAGKFRMGDLSKPHLVTLTRPYYLGVYEVTQEEYQRVIGTNPSQLKGWCKPVDNVSWHEAVEFCQKLSELPEEKSAGRVYRLPTEAEWEYACRAGTTTKYSFGDTEHQLGDYAWYKNNAKNTTHPVGEKKPNPWGLYDMCGNVWEWCQDWFGKYPSGTATNPQGPNKGSSRVVRGGSWNSVAGDCRSADGDFCKPYKRGQLVGFRVAVGL